MYGYVRATDVEGLWSQLSSGFGRGLNSLPMNSGKILRSTHYSRLSYDTIWLTSGNKCTKQCRPPFDYLKVTLKCSHVRFEPNFDRGFNVSADAIILDMNLEISM